MAPGSNTCGTSVGPNAVCTVMITFSPTAGGLRTGTVTFSDGAGNSPQQLALSGTGVDFALGNDGPSSMTIASGGSATYALLLNSTSGISGNAGFTCSGLPANSICTVNPPSMPLGGGNTLVTVTVATGVAASARLERPTTSSAATGISWALLLFPFGYAGLKRRRLPLRLVSLALATAAVLGCGAGRTLPGNGTQSPTTSIVTPQGTYSINVAASSAGLVRAVTLTLVVK